MNLCDWIERDFAVIDGVESVTYTQRGASIEIDGVKAQPLRREAVERLSDSLGLESNYRGFSLPVVNLAAIKPLPGDTLVDESSAIWRVLSAALVTVETRWIVVCIRAR